MAQGDPTASGFVIRRAGGGDAADLLALAARLTAGLPPWRDADRWIAAAQGWVRAWAARDPGGDDSQAVFVAVDGAGRCVGFVDVAARRHFTGDADAYVGELAVAAEVEGHGIGARLMAEAERWARQRGMGLLGLDVSAANARARALYHRLGYAEESVRLVKILGTEPAAGT